MKFLVLSIMMPRSWIIILFQFWVLKLSGRTKWLFWKISLGIIIGVTFMVLSKSSTSKQNFYSCSQKCFFTVFWIFRTLRSEAAKKSSFLNCRAEKKDILPKMKFKYKISIMPMLANRSFAIFCKNMALLVQKLLEGKKLTNSVLLYPAPDLDHLDLSRCNFVHEEKNS